MTHDALDWGPATPELYNDEALVAMHVVNVKCFGKPNRARVCRFVIGRVLYYSTRLPTGCIQHVRFDVRGQHVSGSAIDEMRATITSATAEHGLSIIVDFLWS